MKAAVTCVAMLVSLLCARGAGGGLEHVSVFGTEYVRLDEWAAVRGFSIKWLGLDDVQLEKPGATLNFSRNSRKFAFNGVGLPLSVPIAVKDGAAFIAPLDVSTVMNPLLSPTKLPAGQRIKTICLDPGHGGHDTGKRDGVQVEKTYALMFAKEVSERLKQAGFKVVLTRRSDQFVDLTDRAGFARRKGADLFVSLHFNSAGREHPEVKGLEVYCMTPPRGTSTNAGGEGAENTPSPGNRNDDKNVLLAYKLQKAIVKTVELEDRGVKRARFMVLRLAEMPAVLIEGGFMSHPAEAKNIYSTAWRNRMAQAIAEGVLAYKRTVEP